jgi:long-chain acyl-CoA synthetase
VAVARGGVPMNIANGIREFAVATPRAVAVRDGERELTYGALDERASRLASCLLDRGLKEGDRVGVLLGNRMEFVEIAAGLAKAGLVMVPMNPRLMADEVGYIMGHSSARALVLDEAYAAAAATCVDDNGLATVLSLGGTALGPSYDEALAAARPKDPRVRVNECDPFTVAYTSGTTGRPKGVLISHRSRCLTFYGTALEWGLGPGRRTIAVAPMYHGAGFAFAYAAVHTGGTVSMLRAFDPEQLLAMVATERAHSVFLVPTHAQMLRGLGDDAIASTNTASLETLYFNAAPMPMPLKEWVLDAFPHVGLHDLYGSTEAGIVTNLRPADQRRKPGSVGPPWFMTELRVVDDAGDPVVPGAPGELFSRSPYLMNGYLDDEEATVACTTDDGFLSSGDVATIDDEGYVTIVDRVKDLIITGGVNVYPREVENVVIAHPAVADVAVVGLPSETWGEQVTAVVVRRPDVDVTAETLDEYCREQLAGFKRPKRWEFITSLPRSPAGKVLKRDLRVQYTDSKEGVQSATAR